MKHDQDVIIIEDMEKLLKEAEALPKNGYMLNSEDFFKIITSKPQPYNFMDMLNIGFLLGMEYQKNKQN